MKVFPDYTPPVQPNASIVPVNTSVVHAAPKVTTNAPEQPNASIVPSTTIPKAGGLTSAVTVRKQINATMLIVDTDLINAK